MEEEIKPLRQSGQLEGCIGRTNQLLSTHLKALYPQLKDNALSFWNERLNFANERNFRKNTVKTIVFVIIASLWRVLSLKAAGILLIDEDFFSIQKYPLSFSRCYRLTLPGRINWQQIKIAFTVGATLVGFNFYQFPS